MKIHEYQAKGLLKKFGVPVPEGEAAFSADEAIAIAKKIGGRVVIKAQIHAGGRGKGGGVKIANDADEVKDIAGAILGMTLVTQQTGTAGKLVNKVLVEKAYDIERELYLGMTLDRSTARVMLIASNEGGMEIEAVAARSPEKIIKSPLPLFASAKGGSGSGGKGGMGGIIGGVARKLNLRGDLAEKFAGFAACLYHAYIECDASLIEINPLVVTKAGDILALDAKINLDDNALFRHPDLAALLDPDEEDPAELEAKKHDLSYISLNGGIGCMVNGAGLAMATMDIIKLAGGEPANFLDVGGAATKENVTEAFKIILRDPKVKAILINIFGGIVKCDMIAEGIVAAAKTLSVKMPLVVRLQGTNVERGREILQKSKLNITSAETLDEAAEKVVECIRRCHCEAKGRSNPPCT